MTTAATFRPAGAWHLLRPSVLSGVGVWRRLSPLGKLGAAVGIILAVWGCVVGWRWVIDFAMSVEGIGTAVADRLLALMFLIVGGMLTFSAMLASLGILYLSPEVGLLRTLPTPITHLYLNRSVQVGVTSGWMVLVFGTALLWGQWQAMAGPPLGFALLILGFLAFVMLIVNVAAMIVSALVRALPAQQARHIVMVLSTVLLTGLVAMIRLLRPERLANPEAFESAARYLATLAGPGMFFLPNDWLYQAGVLALQEQYAEAAFYVAYLWVAASLAYLCAGWVYEKVLDDSYTKTREVALSPLRRGRRSAVGDLLVRVLPVETSLALKEGREFMRNPNQVVQLLLLAALVGVYLYNFKALRLQGGVLDVPATRNVLSLFNMALGAFVLGAVAQRLFFMRHGQDPKAMWVIRTMPLSAARVFRYELLSAFFPLLLLEGALLVVSGAILRASLDLTVLGVLNAVVFTWIVTHLTVYTSWRWPPSDAGAQITLGGVLLILLSIGSTVVILFLERLPVLLGMVRGNTLPMGYVAWLGGITLAVVVSMAWVRRQTLALYVAR